MDFISDKSGRVVNFIASRLELPETVKAAALAPQDLSGLSASAFADPIRKEYPLHTKEATLWSALYAHAVGRTGPLFDQRLKAALAKHDLVEDFEFCTQRFKQASKSAEKTQFALNVELRPGTVEGFYPINTLGELEDSAKQACQDYRNGRLTHELFYDACQNFVKRANELGTPPHKSFNVTVLDYGVARMPDQEKAAAALNARYAITGDEAYKMLADNIIESPDEAREVADLASRLDIGYWEQFPKLANLQAIHRAVFCGPTVEAMQKVASTFFLVGDVPVPLSVLDNLSEDQLNVCIGRSKIAAVLEAKEAAKKKDLDTIDRIFEELNDDDRTSFLRYISTEVAA